MWKRQEEPPNDNPGRSAPPANPLPGSPAATVQPEIAAEPGRETGKPAVAHIGKSVQIKGELFASEDLYVDGQVEGTIELRDHQLTIGPSGKVQAVVNARNIIIHGTVKGNIRALDSVDVRKSGSLVGDLVVAGVIIAEGAYFKGSIDIQKANDQVSKQAEPRKAVPPPPPPPLQAAPAAPSLDGESAEFAGAPIAAKRS